MPAPSAPLPRPETELTVEAQPAARRKYLYLFWVRFSSAGGLILPAIAATAFVWSRTRIQYEALSDGTLVPDTLTQGANYIFWTIWLPIAAVSLVAGVVCGWLAWRALQTAKRRLRLTPNGIEVSSLWGSLHLPWSAVKALDIGNDLDFRHELGTITLREDWAGREQWEAVLAYAKARLPKERVHQAPGPAEKFLLSAMKALPYVFLSLLAALAAAILYWVFFRRP